MYIGLQTQSLNTQPKTIGPRPSDIGWDIGWGICWDIGWDISWDIGWDIGWDIDWDIGWDIGLAKTIGFKSSDMLFFAQGMWVQSTV